MGFLLVPVPVREISQSFGKSADHTDATVMAAAFSCTCSSAGTYCRHVSQLGLYPSSRREMEIEALVLCTLPANVVVQHSTLALIMSDTAKTVKSFLLNLFFKIHIKAY